MGPEKLWPLNASLRRLKKKLKLQIVNVEARRVTWKVSTPSHTQSPPANLPSDKDGEANADKCHPGHWSYFYSQQSGHREDRKCSSTTCRLTTPSESLFDSESDTHSTHRCSRRGHRSECDGPKEVHPENNCFCDAPEYRNYAFTDRSSKYDDSVAEGVVIWENRLHVQMKTYIFDGFHPSSTIGFFINVQTLLWYKWHLRKSCHAATTLFHERAVSRRPKLSNSTIVKVSQILQGRER